jgi:hypothetical protein
MFFVVSSYISSHMRIVVAAVIGIVFAAQSGWVLYSQTAKPPGQLRTEKVKGDLYTTVCSSSTTCSTAITPASSNRSSP